MKRINSPHDAGDDFEHDFVDDVEKVLDDVAALSGRPEHGSEHETEHDDAQGVGAVTHHDLGHLLFVEYRTSKRKYILGLFNYFLDIK